jgi:hypothetical protein
MKLNYIFIAVSLLFTVTFFAQTTETFESETNNNTSFTDNSQVFNISSQAGGMFKITDATGTGWSGSAIDNKYIDNSGTADQGIPVQFTIKTNPLASIKLKSIYLFLSKNDLTAGTGSCTITGKLGGSIIFTATSSSGFNTNPTVNNGFTFINLVTFGGVDNSNKTIDEFVITTTGEFEYVALDAMTWMNIPLGLDSLDTKAFHFYPNPVKNNLNLSYTNEITSVKVLNLLGQTVLNQPIKANEGLIEMSHLEKGTYFIEIVSGPSSKIIKVLKE